MSQRDLVAELRGSRIPAPAELRAHVRSIAAAGAGTPRRNFTWRRALVVALPAAAAGAREDAAPWCGECGARVRGAWGKIRGGLSMAPFVKDRAPAEMSTLSLHEAVPI